MRELLNEILQGNCLDVLKTLPDESVNTCVTSPPYWGLRDYGVNGQLGLEKTPEEYVANMVDVFREVRRVLRDDGTLWLNLGDSYFGTGGDRINSPGNGPNSCVGPTADASSPRTGRVERHKALAELGLKPKDLVGIPWRVAFALQADGWYLRSDIIWHKPNPMPESVKDRPTKAHEYIFLLTKSDRYYYDSDSIREAHVNESNIRNKSNETWGSSAQLSQVGNGIREWNHPLGRNKRTVWSVNVYPFSGAHFATFPPKLIEPCILAGCPENGIVLDPFFGSGTTGMVARQYNRNFVGIELNPEYIEIAKRRLANIQGRLNLA